MNDVVVTGLGVVCPVANSVPQFENALRKGLNGIDNITLYNTRGEDIKIAGEVKNCTFSDYMCRATMEMSGRATKLGIAASRQALEDSAINVYKENENMALITGTAIGEINKVSNYYDKMKDPFVITGVYSLLFTNDIIPTYIAAELGIRGINYSISCGCSSANMAISAAIMLLKQKKYKYILVCGTEAPIDRYIIRSFNRSRMLSSNGIKPFDNNSDGIVLSEGAGALMLELEENAKERGAKIYCKIPGTGYSCDSYSVNTETPGIEGKKKAVQNALSDAQVIYKDIDYINTYGCGLRHIDLEEIGLINEVFKERASSIYIGSTKSMVGHALGASAAIECISVILGINHNFLPPTINLENIVDNCSMNFIRGKSIHKIYNTVLKVSYAPGNKNTAIIMASI